MKIALNDGAFNTRMEPSDWRYSAAIVGLIRYFRHHQIYYTIDDDGLNYNAEDLDEQRYLQFAEQYFYEYMHHKKIEDLIFFDELSEDQIKLCNEALKGNKVCKGVFENLTYEECNRAEIQRRIQQNRADLIKETFRYGKSLYAKFCNKNSLFKEEMPVCRLMGYYVDTGRKMRSISYAFNKKTFVYEDVPEFDFIPFAFTKTREGLFINNNVTIRLLMKANDNLHKALEENAPQNLQIARRCVFIPTAYADSFINYDVEVILKDQEQDFFETMFIRKRATKIFSQIGNAYELLTRTCYVENSGIDAKGYIPVEKIVTDSIVNFTHLDHLIEVLLKAQEKETTPRYVALLNVLLKINGLIYGGEKMNSKIDAAKKTAAIVVKKLYAKRADNKRHSYRQKLISALTFKDYDRFCEVLLQMSSYVGIPFDFAYDLFDDFEANKNVAYAFVNRLNGEYQMSENEEDR